ncbi:MAG: hypothetical protein OEM02_07870 [Desulfobulbaceae bacterium]|nr:hypothetical protein [Desulfobulbaceae bacterium]
MYINKMIINIILAVIIIVAASGCGHSLPKEQNIPQGFASYEETETIRAVSSSGVMYRIKREKNEPYAELAFWKEALKKRMLDAGYIYVKDGDIKVGKRSGYLLELAAPLGTQDFTYLIAVCLQDNKQLVIVEAAGEMVAFLEKRQTIISTIEQLEL